MVKPSRVWKASDSGVFFIKFYIFNLIFCILCSNLIFSTEVHRSQPVLCLPLFAFKSRSCFCHTRNDVLSVARCYRNTALVWMKLFIFATALTSTPHDTCTMVSIVWSSADGEHCIITLCCCLDGGKFPNSFYARRSCMLNQTSAYYQFMTRKRWVGGRVVCLTK